MCEGGSCDVKGSGSGVTCLTVPERLQDELRWQRDLPLLGCKECD